MSGANGRISSDGFFYLFDLPATTYRPQVLEELGRAMNDARTGGPGIDAGYTYVAQFIAHDIAHLTPPGDKFNASTSVVQRSPTLDLDSIYGQGFSDKSIGVNTDTGKMQLGCVYDVHTKKPTTKEDLPRDKADKHALIGDERNDENLLIAQLHMRFLKLHNYFVDCFKRSNDALSPNKLYEAARDQLILHFQHIVLHDFLKTILDPRAYEYVILQNRGTLLDPVPGEVPLMPIEFAAAAFRFGHSMVNRSYDIRRDANNNHETIDSLLALTKRGKFGGAGRLFDKHVVDWDLFFETPGVQSTNQALKMDVEMVILLPGNSNLAIRNLLTGNRLGLPDGQAVVTYLLERYPYLSGVLGLRHLTAEELNPKVQWDSNNSPREPILNRLTGEYGIARKSPLWYYILCEAAAINSGRRLGPLGSLLVAEVIRALIVLSSPSLFDPASTLHYINPDNSGPSRLPLKIRDLLDVVRQPERCDETEECSS